MSRSLNKSQIIGHLGQDPELRYTGDGTAVANFSVATNQYDRDEPEWHNCTAWGSLAEVVGEHLAKGERVFVGGSLRTRQWEDSDGRTRYSTEIHADEIIFLGSDQPGSSNGSASGDNAGGQSRQKQPAAGGETREFEPDNQMPF
jgi:single-strand DNA-binding protein